MQSTTDCSVAGNARALIEGRNHDAVAWKCCIAPNAAAGAGLPFWAENLSAERTQAIIPHHAVLARTRLAMADFMANSLMRKG